MFVVDLLSVMDLTYFNTINYGSGKNSDSSPSSDSSDMKAAMRCNVRFARGDTALRVFSIGRLGMAARGIARAVRFASSGPTITAMSTSNVMGTLATKGAIVATGTGNMSTGYAVAIASSNCIPALRLGARGLALGSSPFILRTGIGFGKRCVRRNIRVS